MIRPTVFGPTRQRLDPKHPEAWPTGWVPAHSDADRAFRDATNESRWPEALDMVSAGQNPAVVSGDYSLTALHHLCFARHLPETMWRAVLGWGLPVNQLDADGQPPILTLVGPVRSRQPWTAHPWAVEQDMTRPLMAALIERGASHGVADSLANGHLPMVLHAALQTDVDAPARLGLAFEHLPRDEHARGWAWALWGAAIQGAEGEPVHRWLMDHPPVWSEVDWGEAPYRTLEPLGLRSLRYTGLPAHRYGSPVAALTREGLRARFDEVVVKHRGTSPDALHLVLREWALTTDAGRRREWARQARALVRAGTSQGCRVQTSDGQTVVIADDVLLGSPEARKLLTRLEPLERAATERALREEARVVMAALDDPVPLRRPRARL